MFNAIVFILGFVFFYCMFLWLDKRKQKRKEEELNSIRKIQFKPRKIEAKLPATVESIGPIANTFKYRGLYKPGMAFEEGDIVTRDGGEYVYTNGKLVNLGIL